MRSCEVCRGAYVPTSGKQRYCRACMYRVLTCEGCGESFQVLRRAAAGRRFCTHACAMATVAPSIPRRRGKSNNRYNGGFSESIDGRGLITCRDGTLMLYYRAVMVAHLGRLLTPEEVVHHLNGDPTDDRLENLQITTAAEHARLHAAERRVVAR